MQHQQMFPPNFKPKAAPATRATTKAAATQTQHGDSAPAQIKPQKRKRSSAPEKILSQDAVPAPQPQELADQWEYYWVTSCENLS